MQPTFTVRGIRVFKELLGLPGQRAMLQNVRQVIAAAPLFSPETRFGKSMSVQMTSAGKYGWYSDRRGYRYEPAHPSGVPWPPIPQSVLAVWQTVTELDRSPDCCLINFYGPGARMGLHQDRDEADFRWPVVSISLGDAGLFRVGNLESGGKTESIWLESGDVIVMGGAARLLYHGIDGIRHQSPQILAAGGRINLTLRVVD